MQNIPSQLGKQVANLLISKGAKEITNEWIKNSNNKNSNIIKGIIHRMSKKNGNSYKSS